MMTNIFGLAASIAGRRSAYRAQPFQLLHRPKHGVGSIKILLKAAQPIRVTSRGRPDSYGGMYLD